MDDMLLPMNCDRYRHQRLHRGVRSINANKYIVLLGAAHHIQKIQYTYRAYQEEITLHYTK